MASLGPVVTHVSQTTPTHPSPHPTSRAAFIPGLEILVSVTLIDHELPRAGIIIFIFDSSSTVHGTEDQAHFVNDLDLFGKRA